MASGFVQDPSCYEFALSSGICGDADLALEAAKKLLSQGSSKEGNSMLYDQFLAETGDTDDRN